MRFRKKFIENWISVYFYTYISEIPSWIILKERVPSTTTVRELKELFEKKYPAFYPERQAFFLDKRSPAMPNNDCLATHGMTNECQLLFHDLGFGFNLFLFLEENPVNILYDFPEFLPIIWRLKFDPVKHTMIFLSRNWTYLWSISYGSLLNTSF